MAANIKFKKWHYIIMNIIKKINKKELDRKVMNAIDTACKRNNIQLSPVFVKKEGRLKEIFENRTLKKIDRNLHVLYIYRGFTFHRRFEENVNEITKTIDTEIENILSIIKDVSSYQYNI